jgi:hypothetical protein
MKLRPRYLIAIIFVIAILLLAQGGAAWSGPQNDDLQSAQPGGSAGLQEGRGRGGTVKPPPNYVIITAPGTYSLGGCLIRVDFLAPNVTLTVSYLSRFHNERKLDTDHPVFLAGTCLVRYYVDGKQVDQIEDPAQATVFACFAPLRTDGIVHEYSQKTRVWTQQATTLQVYDSSTGTWRLAQPGEPALTCGQANLSGYYLVAGH